MKRIISFILMLAMLLGIFSFTGCGKKEAHLYMLGFDCDSLYNSFVIKTANDKIIVIDGGASGNGRNNDPYMPSAIRAILGLKEDAYFEIEAWFITHEHEDHFFELAKCLNKYDKTKPECNYKINNIYFDFPQIYPELDDGWKSQNGTSDYTSEASFRILKAGLLNYYKQNGLVDEKEYSKDVVLNKINGTVINKEKVKEGLTIEIDGVKFEILKAFNKEDKLLNSTSIVMRMDTGKHSVLFLADAHSDAGKWLLDTYSADRLKAEYVQMAHHGQNAADKEFYDAIDATHSKRLWPTPKWVWEVGAGDGLKTAETRSWVGLPEDYKEFKKSENDRVFGLYEKFPDDIHSVKSWKAVLKEQMVF